MGLWDKITDAFDEKTEKVPGGFDPAVCEGCPHRGDGPLARCDLCGCPTVKNGTLDLSQRTPEGCPREAAHKQGGER